MSNPYHTQVGGDHYRNHPVQLAEFLNRNEVPWAVGEVIAHVFRYREKQGVEDLRKAAHYIEMLIYEELQNGDRSIGGARRADERSGRTEPTPTVGTNEAGDASSYDLRHDPERKQARRYSRLD